MARGRLRHGSFRSGLICPTAGGALGAVATWGAEGGEGLRTRYVTGQRRPVASVCREITRECKARGLRVTSRGTVLRRIARLDPVRTTSARKGRDAARALKPAGGVPPEITELLEQVQADHTPIDAIVGDERHRLPVGPPYLTVAIGLSSRCVLGVVVTLPPPAATLVWL